MLHVLIGTQVTGVSREVAEYHALSKERPTKHSPDVAHAFVIGFGEYRLSIVNPMSLVSKGADRSEIGVVVGRTVVDVEESQETATIQLTDGYLLRIDLREENYVGPEAMVLTGPGGLCVVWNGN